MKISARVDNSLSGHLASVETNGTARSITIPAKDGGFGSGMNGGELLFLALATCYCNDIYREAAKRGLKIERVEVEVQGEFGAEGEPARNITYRAKIAGDASDEQIDDLLRHTDTVAEIQNTLRNGAQVTLMLD
jgi:uncharacterized OsmC-like protein